MRIQVTYEGNTYTLVYNRQSGYFEQELVAEVAGVNELNIQAIDLLDNVETRNYKFQVIANETIQETKEIDIAYIFDFQTLKLKDIQKISDYNIDLDDETNAISSIKFPKRFNASEKDYVFLKKRGSNFLGIFQDLTEMKDNNEYTVQALDVSNIFDEKIFLTNEALIKTTGIEDFIKKNIEDYFSQTYDNFVNLDYIEIHVNTHTVLQKSVDTDEEGLYNFHTFIINCRQNYDVFTDFEINDGKLIITIEKKQLSNKFIDGTVADIIDYKKVSGEQITSKVEVWCKDTEQLIKYCLDVNAGVQLYENVQYENRVEGNTDRIVVENHEEAFQKAVDQFKGNDYNYLIQFLLSIKSKIMPADDLKLGMPVTVKTEDQQIVNGYITAKTEKKDNNLIEFKVGKIRKTLRQQLRKEQIK